MLKENGKALPQSPALNPCKSEVVWVFQSNIFCCPLPTPGCHFKTVHGMKDLDRHLRIHTGRCLSHGSMAKGEAREWL